MEARLDAVWAAVYVEVLAAPARAANVVNYNPQGALTDLVSGFLSDDSLGHSARVELAIQTADDAVAKLRKLLVAKARRR